LSARGGPVPSVKRLLVDVTVPCVAWRADGVEYFLAGPTEARITWQKFSGRTEGSLPASHIGFDVAKGRLEPALVGISRSYAHVGFALRW
jgi:hypothetical protein